MWICVGPRDPDTKPSRGRLWVGVRKPRLVFAEIRGAWSELSYGDTKVLLLPGVQGGNSYVFVPPAVGQGNDYFFARKREKKFWVFFSRVSATIFFGGVFLMFFG